MPANLVSLVGTGDGTDELIILEAFGEIYNGEKGIWWPKLPFKPPDDIVKKGFAMLDSITPFLRLCPSNDSYFFLVDREYVNIQPKKKGRESKKPKTLRDRIIKRLRDKNIKTEHFHEIIRDSSFHLRCKCGSRTLNVYIAISGEELRLEEEISKLIEELEGIKLPPDKDELRNYFRTGHDTKSIGEGTAKLIRKATHEQLESCFPSITSIFRLLEDS